MDCAATMPADGWMVMLRNAATTHKGHFRPKGAETDTYYHFNDADAPMESKDWLKLRRIIVANVPAGWTCKRANDQRMFNSIIRWKYDKTLAELSQSTDFRQASNKNAAETVLTALAITVDCMNKRRGCRVAAWLMSGNLIEEDYKKAGLGRLVDEAWAAMHNLEFQEATSEYTKGRVLGDTRTVFLLNQVCEVLNKAEQPQNSAHVEQTVGQLAWLCEASTGTPQMDYGSGGETRAGRRLPANLPRARRVNTLVPRRF